MRQISDCIPIAERRRHGSGLKEIIGRSLFKGIGKTRAYVYLSLACGHTVRHKGKHQDNLKRRFCEECYLKEHPPTVNLDDERTFDASEAYCIACRKERVEQAGDECEKCRT